jgi:hypothetical protein
MGGSRRKLNRDAKNQNLTNRSNFPKSGKNRLHIKAKAERLAADQGLTLLDPEISRTGLQAASKSSLLLRKLVPISNPGKSSVRPTREQCGAGTRGRGEKDTDSPLTNADLIECLGPDSNRHRANSEGF